MEPENQERLDAWLQRALEEYGKAEPPPGLENRVLANLAGQRERGARRWWWALGMAGAGVAAACAVWVGNGVRKSSPPTNMANGVSPIRQEAPTSKASRFPDLHPTVGAAGRISKGHPQQKQIEVAVTPKLAQFPSPTPLSEQEQLLARCVNEFPRETAMMAKEQAEWQLEAAEEMKQWGKNLEDSRR